MGYTTVLEAVAARIEGSSPSLGTNIGTIPNLWRIEGLVVQLSWKDSLTVKNGQRFDSVILLQYSHADVVRHMGQTVAGTSYAAAKRAIKRFHISISHFDPKQSTRISRQTMSTINGHYPLDVVLTENSSYNKHSLRKRLIKEQLIPYQCKCGNVGEWLGEPLTLQLEHKNGDNKDNRLCNLEFLCPNCHTQTPTWGRKNRKESQ